MPGVPKVRVIALLSAGALAVHELRYLAAFGSRTDEALVHEGHAYLNALTPLVGVTLACLLGHLLYRVAWGRDAQGRGAPTRTAAAAAFAVGLLAIYVGQELIEGLLAAGHPGGLHGVFGHGGWLAVPMSGALGLGLSLLVRCARAAVARVRGAIRLLAPRMGHPAARASAATVVVAVAAPLARHRAGRAPPVAVA
jgi:hypothetical protein